MKKMKTQIKLLLIMLIFTNAVNINAQEQTNNNQTFLGKKGAWGISLGGICRYPIVKSEFDIYNLKNDSNYDYSYHNLKNGYNFYIEVFKYFKLYNKNNYSLGLNSGVSYYQTTDKGNYVTYSSPSGEKKYEFNYKYYSNNVSLFCKFEQFINLTEKFSVYNLLCLYFTNSFYKDRFLSGMNSNNSLILSFSVGFPIKICNSIYLAPELSHTIRYFSSLDWGIYGNNNFHLFNFGITMYYSPIKNKSKKTNY